MHIYKSWGERTVEDDKAVFSTVKNIITDVREKGDNAVSFYNVKFGGLPSASFAVPQKVLDKAYAELPEDLREAMEIAAQNLEKFAKRQKKSLSELDEKEISEGVFLGHNIIPVDSCCCYVPGGNHPLFSTALMLAIPAKVAGVQRVCAAVPPMNNSILPHPYTLAALKIAGVEEVYAMGGAQAIAAVAYGTETIKPVTMIVGPGNKYVTEAKRQVYGRVGIDFIAGPSEVLVIADGSANETTIAKDLLAQAEHDCDAAAILITTSDSFAEKVEREVKRLLKELDTSDIASVSWEKNGRIIVADSEDEAVELSNEIAPEHLEVNMRSYEDVLPRLKNYGSLFIGEGAAEVFGDYIAGTNHTLPTMGAARYTGGVSVLTFLKVCTFQRCTQAGCNIIGPLAETMARYEGLTAHGDAAAARVRN